LLARQDATAALRITRSGGVRCMATAPWFGALASSHPTRVVQRRSAACLSGCVLDGGHHERLEPGRATPAANVPCAVHPGRRGGMLVRHAASRPERCGGIVTTAPVDRVNRHLAALPGVLQFVCGRPELWLSASRR